MHNFILTGLFVAFTFAVSAQNDIDRYLKNHHYAFSLESGFDEDARHILSEKLANYNVLVQAEGGSHNLESYIKNN